MKNNWKLYLSHHFTLLLLFCLVASALHTQNVRYQALQAPKQELRAAWVATVLNIDYPRKPSTNPIALKEQYRIMLDQLQELGINTVIVQVRPAGDALYPSQYAPWSAYLTGKQGRPPKEEFDPLAFMIEESHKRSLEFHAWINPFRASMNLDTASLFLTHPVFKNPNWLVTYGGKMYFNPGLPDVRDHLLDVVGELVDNYKIDGLHIDDYFYPYPIKDTPFPDSTTHRFYGRLTPDINEWRRSNTNDLVQRIHTRIKESKPNIQFGVSPFGVWRNKSDEAPGGSDTRAGATSYDHLYADVLHWMNEGWIDYIMPQLYWNIGFAPADHQVLVQWWSQHARDVQLFIGHSAYKVGNNKEAAWNEPGEIPRQIDLNRRNFTTQGSAYFSAKSLLSNPLHLKDSLRRYYRTKALWPERPTLAAPALQAPDLKRPRWRHGKVRLRWRPNRDDIAALRRPHYYVVYRFRGSGRPDFENPENILHIMPFQEELQRKIDFYDDGTQEGQQYLYAVTAVNVGHQEGASASSIRMERTDKKIRRARERATSTRKRNRQRRQP